MGTKRDKFFELNQIDPLSRAEELSGKSYKEDDATMFHGMQMQFRLSEAKDKILTELGDTTFRTERSRYIEIIENFGFEMILHESFNSISSKQEENFYIYFHPLYSIVLRFDTYHGNVNSSSFYFNYAFKGEVNVDWSGHYYSTNWDLKTNSEKPNPIPEPRLNVNNQTWEEYKNVCSIWRKDNKKYKEENDLYYLFVGDIDGREGLISKLTRMIEGGTFLTEWVETPFLWLLHGGNEKKMITKESIQKLLIHYPRTFKNF
jgi:hypothetical protein